ncbi:DUF4442 domain-containing protein [Nannocystis pusilla]|uniref:DUF4442 domain-containing protein n=1 Tax=Nannocystis pusilla TaxID=889268 RepID=A0A9X3J1G6_9BACT|nr:DUF4442 domain-containing protein [Nannocystis pusilla]MCY1011651.1 DUF4442 domain-containing protein [Nannocystis pusilla]
MKLGLDTLRDPTRVLDMWKSLSAKTFGKQLFARAISLAVPYTGSISPLVLELEAGRAKVQMRDRWGVRNHLRCVHAVALMNLGEAVTGLAVMSLLPPGARGIVRELAMEYVKKARGTITGDAQVQVPAGPGRTNSRSPASSATASARSSRACGPAGASTCPKATSSMPRPAPQPRPEGPRAAAENSKALRSRRCRPSSRSRRTRLHARGRRGRRDAVKRTRAAATRSRRRR